MIYQIQWILYRNIEADDINNAADIAKDIYPIRDGDWDGKFTVLSEEEADYVR